MKNVLVWFRFISDHMYVDYLDAKIHTMKINNQTMNDIKDHIFDFYSKPVNLKNEIKVWLKLLKISNKLIHNYPNVENNFNGNMSQSMKNSLQIVKDDIQIFDFMIKTAEDLIFLSTQSHEDSLEEM